MKLTEKMRFMLKVRKHRVFSCICAIVLLVMIITVILIKPQTTTTAPPSVAEDTVTMQIGDRFEQSVSGVEGDLTSVNINFGKSDSPPAGEVTLLLYDGETAVQSWTEDAKTISDQAEITMAFELDKAVASSAQTTYRLVIDTSGMTEGILAVQSTEQADYLSCSVNGVPVEGRALVYNLTYVSAISKTAHVLFVASMILLALVLIATAFVLLYTKIKPAVLFASLVLVLGGSFIVCITPFSAPDEPHHYYSAFELSNYMMLRGDTAAYGESHYLDFHDLPGHQNTSRGYARVASEIGQSAPEGGELLELPAKRSLTYFVQYIPQATGMTIGRLLGRNLVTVCTLGRLFNLLFYTACVYIALKRLPKFKVPIGIITLFPMTLHQAASLSYDVFVNGMSLVLICSILRFILTDDPITWKDLLFIGIVAVLLAPAKAIYCPLLLLLFLIKKEQFGSAKRKLISIGCILLACILLVLLIQLPTILEMGSRGEVKLNHEGKYNYTFSYALQHPANTVIIFLRSFYKLAFGWCQQAVGSLLSGMTLPIPAWITTAFMFVLFIATFNHPKRTLSLKKTQRSIFVLVIVGIVGLVMASMFFAWTSNTSPTIQGVQGRYFIPLMPVIAVALTNSNFVLKRNISRKLVFGSVFLTVSSLVTVLVYTVTH